MGKLVTKNSPARISVSWKQLILKTQQNFQGKLAFGLFLFELIDHLAYGSSKINHNDPTVAKMDL